MCVCRRASALRGQGEEGERQAYKASGTLWDIKKEASCLEELDDMFCIANK